MEQQNLPANQQVYDSFENSMHAATIMRLLRATHVISELRDRKELLKNDAGSLSPEAVETEPEDSTAWEKISIKTENFGPAHPHNTSLLKQYISATYLRTLQLVTDFLENDRSIPVNSPEQNLNRALNRLILLEQLEQFRRENYPGGTYA